MKAAAVFLTVSVAACFGQNFQWSFSGPAPQNDPFAFLGDKGNRGQLPVFDQQKGQLSAANRISANADLFPSYYNEENSANIFLNSPLDSLLNAQEGGDVESRNQLGVKPRFLNTAFYSFFVTTTTYTISSTITSAVVSSCIPSSQFVAGSTIPCARRRRRGVAYEESFADPVPTPRENELLASFAPSQVVPLEASVEPSLAKRGGPEIASSKDAETGDDSEQVALNRHARQIKFTTTTTSYIFTSTIVKKTVNLINSGSSTQLVCLPSSFTIC